MISATDPQSSINTLLLDVTNAKLTGTPGAGRDCRYKADLRLELTKDRELIVMTPSGGKSSEKNGDF
jgi:Uma2 family endonuclease